MSGKKDFVLTVDWEDWYHICDLMPYADPENWSQFESRIENNTHRLLRLFHEYDAKATFFVIGELARRYPALIHEIQDQGHEIAWHGSSHHTWKTLAEEQLRLEWLDGLVAFTEKTGIRVSGFRAPMWSLTPDLLLSYNHELAALGIQYDASLVPLKIVGNERYPQTPSRLGEIVEMPPSMGRFFGIAAPVSMSWGFRWLPWWYVRHQLKRIRSQKDYLMLAIHPWELDPDHAVVDLPRGIKFSHYAGLRNTEKRLRWVLSQFKAVSCIDYVQNMQNPKDLPKFEL